MNSNDNEKLLTSNNLLVGSNQYQDNVDYLHKGDFRHSKNMVEELDREQQQILLIFKDKIITKDEMQINFMKFKIENAKKIELNPNN